MARLTTPPTLSISEHPHALNMLLRSGISASALMGELMLELSHELSVSLKRIMNVSPDELARFMAPLTDALLSVQHNPGMRRVFLCGESVVFTVQTDEHSEAVLQDSGQGLSFFEGAPAIAMWKLENGSYRHTGQWKIFSASQWHIMLLEWLFHRIQGWLNTLLPDRVGMVSRGAIAREIARQSVRRIPEYAVHLNVLLLDALGYPRSLVVYHMRLTKQYPQLASGNDAAGWKNNLIAHWADTCYWPGRSRKMFPLAVAMAPLLEEEPLTPSTVRDVLLALGLSRNAWAHLARLPAHTLLMLCLALVRSWTELNKRQLLQELSFWLSRLGKEFRYYRIPRDRLVVALVWLVRELSGMRTQSDEGGNSDRILGSGLLPQNLHWHESLIGRKEFSVDHHEKLRLLLLGFARGVLNQSAELSVQLSQLSDVLDWFNAEGLQRPVSWYKQPWNVMLSRSAQWHEELVQQQVREAEERRRVHALENEQSRELRTQATPDKGRSWVSPLPCFETETLLLEALLTSEALREEGRLMQHCVGSYTQACVDGLSLIYAVTHAGLRMGTLELSITRRGEWREVQFKGLRNLDLMHYIQPHGELCTHYQAFKRALAQAVSTQS